MDAKKIGAMIDELWSIRENVRELDSQKKALNKEFAKIESELMHICEEHEIEKADGRYASFSIKPKIMPNIMSKEDFYKWVVNEERFEFAQSRINSAPFTEMLENEGIMPNGVDVFTKLTANLRSK